jgi:hypothetical protein
MRQAFTAAAFAPVLMLRVPSRIEGLRRLDRNSIAAPTEDSYSVALWRAHLNARCAAAASARFGGGAGGCDVLRFRR